MAAEDIKAKDHRLYVAAFVSYMQEHKLDDVAASELIGVPVHYIAHGMLSVRLSLRRRLWTG